MTTRELSLFQQIHKNYLATSETYPLSPTMRMLAAWAAGGDVALTLVAVNSSGGSSSFPCHAFRPAAVGNDDGRGLTRWADAFDDAVRLHQLLRRLATGEAPR